jgi:hypothetical protein
MESKPDFKKLAEDFAKDFQQNWKEEKEIPATLFVDDLLLAIGLVAVSGDLVRFHPRPPKPMDSILHGSISLKVGQNEMVYHLKHSQYLFELSCDSFWYFNYTKKDDL